MTTIPKKVGFMTPCFPLKEEEEIPTEKENSVTYMLKVRSSATAANTQTYKILITLPINLEIESTSNQFKSRTFPRNHILLGLKSSEKVHC